MPKEVECDFIFTKICLYRDKTFWKDLLPNIKSAYSQGGKNFPSLHLGSVAGLTTTKNKVRWINRRKTNSIMYILEPYKDNKTQEQVGRLMLLGHPELRNSWTEA